MTLLDTELKHRPGFHPGKRLKLDRKIQLKEGGFMLKLDVTSLTMQGVYDKLNTDCATYFPAKPAAAAASEVEPRCSR